MNKILDKKLQEYQTKKSIRSALFHTCMTFFLIICIFSSAGPRWPNFPGEEIRRGGGFPALIRFWKGDPTKPLVIFIPGAHHLARISYGHQGCNEKDFLAYWVRQKEYSYLAISYPIEPKNKIFDKAFPRFTVRNWGKQVADIAKQIVDENGLTGNIIPMGWSMGGKIVQSVNEASIAIGLKVDFYISLSASPPIPGLTTGHRKKIGFAQSGLADRSSSYEGWYAEVKECEQLNGHIIIPKDVYMRDYVGHIPVNIEGYPYRYRNGKFVEDIMEGLEDLGTFEFRNFPLVAIMLSDMPRDFRHSLTDMGCWGIFIVNKIYNDYLKGNNVNPIELSPGTWQALLDIVRSSPERLSESVHGNHFFFVGESGARQTAQNIEILINKVRGFKDEICALAGVNIFGSSPD